MQTHELSPNQSRLHENINRAALLGSSGAFKVNRIVESHHRSIESA